MISNGNATEIDSPTQTNRLVGWWDRAALVTARFLVLLGIVVSMWRYGAVETTTLRDLAVIFALANLLAAGSPTVWASRTRFPVLIPAVALAFVLYAAAQFTSFGADAGPSDYHDSFAAQPIAMLVDASDRLSEDPLLLPAPALGSEIPEATRQALVPFVLALMVLVVSSLVFQTRESRKMFLWTIMINAAALTIWGIIQRANNNQEILPGVAYQAHGVPFASFVYKNAGAAALLPAIAITVAMLVHCRRQAANDQGYGATGTFPSVRTLALFSVAALLAAGLAVSLSRGAWIAAAAATIVVAIIERRKLRRIHLLGGLGAIALILAIVGFSRTTQHVVERSADLSLNRVQSDARWQHWVDATPTALSHSPWGSGLGTYGYVTLPDQSRTYVLWFKNAHNQLVETGLESGIFGLVLLGIVVFWFARAARTLSRPEGRTEWKQWGLIAAATLVCAAVQGAVDYVLIIPAILCLYASLIGITGVVLASTRSQPMSQALWRRAMPACWCLIAVFAGGWAYQATSAQVGGNEVLRRSQLISITGDAPTDTEIASQIELLDRAIRKQPGRADLLLRRASWHLANYRVQLLELADKSNLSLRWADTKPDSLFVAIASQQRAIQPAVRKDLLATESMRHDLSLAVADLAHSLTRNPYQPQTYLTSARLAPLLQMPIDQWTQPASRLVNNSCDMLYVNGWVALHGGDTQTAVDQWQKSLSIRGRHLHQIYALALQRLSPEQVASDIIPAHATDLHVRLVKTVFQGDESLVPDLVDQIIAKIQGSEQLDKAFRFGAIARVQTAAGRHRAAVDSCREAVRLDGRNLDYRFRLAQSLRSVGMLDEAIDQISLIQTMSPSNTRYSRFANDVRRQIAHGFLN